MKTKALDENGNEVYACDAKPNKKYWIEYESKIDGTIKKAEVYLHTRNKTKFFQFYNQPDDFEPESPIHFFVKHFVYNLYIFKCINQNGFEYDLYLKDAEKEVEHRKIINSKEYVYDTYFENIRIYGDVYSDVAIEILYKHKTTGAKVNDSKKEKIRILELSVREFKKQYKIILNESFKLDKLCSKEKLKQDAKKVTSKLKNCTFKVNEITWHNNK